jgi:hypothetical protein
MGAGLSLGARCVTLTLVALLLGCSNPPGSATSNGDVSGAWCGIDVATASACVGDSVVYAEFAQTGSTVTGQSCEYYLADCFPIENGAVTNGALVFDYLFAPYRVDATLTLASDGGALLTGKYTSTKCSCDVPLTLHRLN